MKKRRIPNPPRLSHKNFHASHQNMDLNLIAGAVVIVIAVAVVYVYRNQIKDVLASTGIELFESGSGPKKPSMIKTPAANHSVGGTDNKKQAGDKNAKHVVPKPVAPGKEGFADFASVDGEMGPVPMAPAHKPQGCYPREQIKPMDLLPNDPHSQWAQVNPQGAGDILGKNLLSSGALIGINTIGQSLRNANLQLRAEPPCPQQNVSPWNISTIEPDLSRKPLE